MNLTNQKPYQKGQSLKKRNGARPPNAEEERHWQRVKVLGCMARGCGTHANMTRHHCGTRAGGRKDHMKVIGLCWHHHLGVEGIDGKSISTKEWERRYGTETELLADVAERLAMP